MPLDDKPRTFRKILIANRGEIAVRVARTCRDLGITSVAVFADQDKDAPHVRFCDEAYALGGYSPAETYLNIERLVEVAASCGADAVHPGYGFLSENAEFAEAIIDSNMAWIGAPPSSIRKLGDKVQARRLAHKIGVPMAPGTPDPVDDAAQVRSFAEHHGLPVAIKAAFGGGGRGLKVVHDDEEIEEAFDAAVREAVTAFGRGECFVEKFLQRPRHVETQCLADSHGNVVVVGTRDCSLQRRNQKLVEEAPAPFLADEQVQLLIDSSKNLLAEGGYVGAGTCEFLVDTTGAISFLEVNTRLQVEHPVSEQITGLDLVAEQIRLAAGGRLDPKDPVVSGHSIEFRINAEDPATGFMPSLGKLTHYNEPSGPGVRVDSGVEQGSIIGGSFDSMLGKLVVTGRNRDHALRRARRALAEYQVAGLATVLPFHRAVVDHEDFVAPNGDFRVHTRWIDQDLELSLPGQKVHPVSDSSQDNSEISEISVEVDGRRHVIRLYPKTVQKMQTLFGSGLGEAELRMPPPRRVSRSASVGSAVTADDSVVTAPMTGVVVRIQVESGTKFKAGDTLVVVEAMKMEQPIKAATSGTVSKVLCAQGESVDTGTVLVELDVDC